MYSIAVPFGVNIYIFCLSVYLSPLPFPLGPLVSVEAAHIILMVIKKKIKHANIWLSPHLLADLHSNFIFLN